MQFLSPERKTTKCHDFGDLNLKIYSHKNKKFLKYFIRVMFTRSLIKTQHLRIIWKIKAAFPLF